MRDLERMLKVTAVYASGPDDDEDVEIDPNPEEESGDDIITRDEIDDEFLWVAWFQQEEGIVGATCREADGLRQADGGMAGR